MSDSLHRSFEHITNEDLTRLAQIAREDFLGLCERTEYSRPYKDRLRIVCLCQGAARHFTHRDRGVNDFDLWGFFDPIPGHPFPPLRRGTPDFGRSKFGRDPDEGDGYAGRRVDVMGRSIHMTGNESPIESVQRYLRERPTNSALRLAENPVVVVWPEEFCGQVIWTGNSVAQT